MITKFGDDMQPHMEAIHLHGDVKSQCIIEREAYGDHKRRISQSTSSDDIDGIRRKN